MNSRILKRIEKINQELCLPWGIRIANTLFSKTTTKKCKKIHSEDTHVEDEVKTPQGVEEEKTHVIDEVKENETKESAKDSPSPDEPNAKKKEEEKKETSNEHVQQNPEDNQHVTPKDENTLQEKINEKSTEMNKDVMSSNEVKKEGNEAPVVEQKEMKKEKPRKKKGPPSMDELKRRDIIVEFDWRSFHDLFMSLIKEDAEEVIETILDSLVSKECAISLLSSLLQHCKPPAYAGKKITKHEQIRTFLQHGLKKYIIKYSDDPKEWGYYKDGVLCDVVEIDVTDDEKINWIFRDVTQNIENCTELQQFLVEYYYIPDWEERTRNVCCLDIEFEVDWVNIDYAAQDYGKAVYTVYHDRSSYVLEEIYTALEWIATYEDDDLVDAIAYGLKKISVALQPGQDSTKKDFDINDKNKTLTLRCCLEADEFAGVFRHKDLIPIIKLAGLYKTEYTKAYKIELLSAAASIYKVPRGDLSLFLEILNREGYWWTPDEREKQAIEACKKKIEKYYKDRIMVNEDHDEEDDEEEEFEKFIKGWHVIKINKSNLHQERFIILTNKAYWTFKYDFGSKSVDDKHFKRHDLLDFCVSDIGDLEKTEKYSIKALKIYTHEKRKRGFLGKKPKEVLAIDSGRRSKSFSSELRKSISIKATERDELSIFRNLMLNSMTNEQKVRKKKPKPKKDRPITDGCYSSVFIPCGKDMDPHHIKEILTEIAWCVYAAAVSRQRHRMSEPFENQNLTRPKGGITSFIYNYSKWGHTSPSGKSALKRFSFSGKKSSNQPKETASPELERKPSKIMDPNFKLFKTHEPVKDGKAVKSILRKPKQNLAEKCSHDRRVRFNQEVQIFHRDENVVVEQEGALVDDEEVQEL